MRRHLLGLTTMILLTACSSADPGAPAASDGATGAGTEISWSYSGAGAPANWGSLSDDFAVCDTGREQSPIAITNPAEVRRTPPRVRYRTQPATVTNNGHTVEAVAGPGNTMTVDGVDYSLQQMHFHSPAENVIDGSTAPVELHFVHQSPKGEYAVFAVMVTEGARNPGLQPYLDVLNEEVDAENLAVLPWPRMIPEQTSTFRFPGSLTTPDCAEGVEWFVAVNPITADTGQIAQFQAAYDGNARPVQPLNGREVTVDAR